MQSPQSDMDKITAVMNAHTKEWMALSGVQGTYIGARPDSALCIRIMAIKKTKDLEQAIPSRVDGYPVEIEETGEIKPLKKE